MTVTSLHGLQQKPAMQCSYVGWNREHGYTQIDKIDRIRIPISHPKILAKKLLIKNVVVNQ